jgi:hypothetical protein
LQEMVNKIIIFLVLFSSVNFLRLAFLSDHLLYLTEFGITGLMLVFIILHAIYGKTGTIRHHFKQPIFLMLAGVLLSMVIAQAYHGQNFGLTIWAQRFIYFYFLYFFLHILRPGLKDLEKILFTIGIIYAVAYLVQYAMYPTVVFDVKQNYDRGTIRIFLPGASFLTISLFLSLHRFYRENQVRYVFFALLFFAILVLMGTRNFLASVTLVIIFSLLFSKTIRSRYVIYSLILISIVPVYIIFHEIFAGLIELSEQQSQNIENNIRIRSATFFLTDFFPNRISYLFGNGQDHGQSIYGMRIAAYKITYGFYQSDVGIIGDFSKFGIIYMIGFLWLLVKAFTTRVTSRLSYIKYYLLLQFFVLPFGSTGSSSIALMCVLIYIMDKELDESKLAVEEESLWPAGANRYIA